MGQLRHVTLPMLSPVIFYTLILGIVEVLQYFLVPLVLNNGTGEPGGTTLFLNLYIYKNFFTYQNMSYGATLAWLLFVITLAITLVLFGTRGAGSTTRASAEGDGRRASRPARPAPRPGVLVRRRRRMRPRAASRRRSFVLTFVAVVLVAAFLSPLAPVVQRLDQEPDQIRQVDAPLWPASP